MQTTYRSSAVSHIFLQNIRKPFLISFNEQLYLRKHHNFSNVNFTEKNYLGRTGSQWEMKGNKIPQYQVTLIKIINLPFLTMFWNRIVRRWIMEKSSFFSIISICKSKDIGANALPTLHCLASFMESSAAPNSSTAWTVWFYKYLFKKICNIQKTGFIHNTIDNEGRRIC